MNEQSRTALTTGKRWKVSRRGLLQGAGATALAMNLPTVGSSVSAQETPAQGGSITWAVDTLVNTLPYGAIGQPHTHVFVYNSLLQWDQELLEEPGLAESWEAVDDQTYVFTLREGVVFHNGKELDAEDVKYSLELHRDPPPPGQSFAFYPKIDTVEVIDSRTVQINLTEPDPSLIGYMTWTRYSNIMPVGMAEEINPLAEGIGTGPFKLVEFVADSVAVLQRNEDYWEEDLPYLDEITLQFLPDEGARVAALRSGNIDGASFTPDVVATLQGDESLTVLSGLQANHREIQVTTKGDPKPWHDIRVRQAINHAINRQDLIDKVYGGEAEVSGVIPTGYGAWPIPVDELRNNYLAFDLDKARQLMIDAGYEDGFEVTLQSIAIPRDFTQCAEVVREHLAEINIEVNVEPLEFGAFAENNGQGNFDMQLTGRGFRGDPSGFLNEFNPASTIFQNWFGEGWENEELTDLLNAGLQTADVDERMRIYTRAQEILLTEQVHITLAQPLAYHVVRNRLKNMAVSFTNDIAYPLKYAWVEE
jgi:peptide/nickel transport system substrate-binding protein